ncbi:MAG: hypothetical protein K2G03_01550 [Bacilli bacterium]|nr:hypothetical protein [Bacilli bacterium]
MSSLKKRILSAAILITVLGSGMYLGAKENRESLARQEEELYRVINEVGIDRESDNEFATLVLLDRLINEKAQEDINELSMDEMHDKREAEQAVGYIGQLRKDGDVLVAYNGYLKEILDSDIGLTEEDITYLSSLDNFMVASIVAIKSPITNHYNTVYTGDDSRDYIMTSEDGTVLITNLNGARANYYDTQIDISSTKELTEEEIARLVPIGEFINTNDMEISGYCFPTFGMATPSDETLKVVAEVYGSDVVSCVKIFGLPVAYYDAKDFDEALSNQDKAVKGLNN